MSWFLRLIFPRKDTLILGHGVFDSAPRHVRHLSYAKSKAKILAKVLQRIT